MTTPSLRNLPPVKRAKVYEKSALEPPVPHPWPMFSVVVCTFNRAELLTLCLDTLVRQQLSPQHYEILVVDNNSSDHTREVVAGFAATHGHVRYVFELEQGLSAARNRGAKEAVGRYLAYLDDECKVPPDWLSQATRVAAETAARIFGGPYIPWYEVRKPAWFRDQYGAKSEIQSDAWMSDTEFASGGNLFIERALVEEIGPFLTDLGMRGERVGYGEDTEFQIRARKRLGVRIYYHHALTVQHCVRAHKLSIRWKLRSAWRTGREHARAMPALRRGRVREVCLLAARVLFLAGSCLRAVILRNRSRYPYVRNYLYEVSSRHVIGLGESFELIATRS